MSQSRTLVLENVAVKYIQRSKKIYENVQRGVPDPNSFSYCSGICRRELTRALGDKGLIDFSRVEHVILKML
ncbi:hypothetical protein PIB30_026838 [Stylosanthes scabra]|uniref:Uncharacterized protein n=1 Tax=Stylosanthes scabra TaxID=79078 RepID=A0ABU6RAR9_9FABA|nr:hypothetical protein [Stylosanthes scabra]